MYSDSDEMNKTSAGMTEAMTRFCSISDRSIALDAWSTCLTLSTTLYGLSVSSTSLMGRFGSVPGLSITAMSFTAPGLPNHRCTAAWFANSTANSPGEGSSPLDRIA